MARRRSVGTMWLRIAGAFAFAVVAFAQQPSTLPSADQELQRRADAQSSARDAGDPTTVRQSSISLAAFALRRLADLKTAEAAYTEAQDLYTQSLAYADEPDTHLQRVIAFLLANEKDKAI